MHPSKFGDLSQRPSFPEALEMSGHLERLRHQATLSPSAWDVVGSMVDLLRIKWWPLGCFLLLFWFGGGFGLSWVGWLMPFFLTIRANETQILTDGDLFSCCQVPCSWDPPQLPVGDLCNFWSWCDDVGYQSVEGVFAEKVSVFARVWCHLEEVFQDLGPILPLIRQSHHEY